ncbi:hypothetical protein BD413DRAFT_632940, partial [Trametes elegans]
VRQVFHHHHDTPHSVTATLGYHTQQHPLRPSRSYDVGLGAPLRHRHLPPKKRRWPPRTGIAQGRRSSRAHSSAPRSDPSSTGPSRHRRTLAPQRRRGAWAHPQRARPRARAVRGHRAVHRARVLGRAQGTFHARPARRVVRGARAAARGRARARRARRRVRRGARAHPHGGGRRVGHARGSVVPRDAPRPRGLGAIAAAFSFDHQATLAGAVASAQGERDRVLASQRASAMKGIVGRRVFPH